MSQVTLRDGALWCDRERVPLQAGEMHYWRLNPARWQSILEQMRRLGLRVVATYVPWEYHELAPGQFDFTGATEPQRNLIGFLDLLATEGFWTFIRPGPFIYAEWTHAGVPERVVTLPRLSDAYRQEARVWMQAVTDIIRPRLATHGGRIVAFQPDNEMDLFSHWFEAQAGLDGDQPGFFQEFLQATYGDVTALNAAWGTKLRSFTEAHPLAVRLDTRAPGDLVRHKDYWRFQHWATMEGVRWHATTYREMGIDVPIVANYYPGGDVQNWREVSKVVDFCGIDWYPRSEFHHDAAEYNRFLVTCRYQRSFSPIPFIAEFECGVWHGFHDYTGALLPNHYRLMGLSAFMAGIQAFNWYMFVARDNWMYSPINERGEVRGELGDVFLHLHRIADECDLPRLRRLTATSAVLEPVQIGTDRLLDNEPVYAALQAADIDFDLYDPELERVAQPVLFYAGADWLPQESQAALVRYMESGGTLVCCQNYPRRDENFQPHNGLDIVPPDHVLSPLGKRVEVALGAERAEASGAVWVWKQPPGTPIVGTQSRGKQQAVENADKWMEQYIGRQWTCGYCEPRGKGRLIVLGVSLNAALARAVVRHTGQPLYVQAELPHVQTALYERDGSYYLFATSLNAAAVQTRVRLDGIPQAARWQVCNLWDQTTCEMSPDALIVEIPAYSAGAWRLTPA